MNEVEQVAFYVDAELKRRMDRARMIGALTIRDYVSRAIRAQVERDEEKWGDTLRLLEEAQQDRQQERQGA